MKNLQRLLDNFHDQILAQSNVDIIDSFAREMAVYYDAAVDYDRLEEFKRWCVSHPVSGLLHKDPYSQRAYTKPRGYAGDAIMLDYIYRPINPPLDDLTAAIHRATTALPNAKSILWRRDYLAQLIAKAMKALTRTRVLSVASGHMREFDALRKMTANTNVSIVALDQDAESIASALTDYSEFQIEGRTATFASLIKNRFKGEGYDLIYSAGLYDYLQKPMAVALTRAMAAHLNPGGTISIGNFTRDSHGRGYMAGFMDWCLVYRNEMDMTEIVSEACPGLEYRIFRDEPGNVIYAEIHKA